MKEIFLSYFIIISSLSASAQIKNPSFELRRDTDKSLPQYWNLKKTIGYQSSLDEKVLKTGHSSYRVNSTPDAAKASYAPFSEIVNINITRLQKLNISAWVKTESVNGSAGLWSQVWDKDKKIIGFQSIQNMGVKIDSTRDWTKYTITLVLDTNAKHLLLGGFLMGTGIVWYDDFSISAAAGANTPPSRQVNDFIKEVTGLIKTNSIYKDSLNWRQINADIEELSKGLQTSADVSVITTYLINKLREAGDRHSTFQSKISTQNYAKGNTVPGQPVARLLPGNIGYIAIPSFGSVNDTASLHFAARIQALIRNLDKVNNIKGWVVDLREDGGGNMWPMIAGLGPIIGNGTLGYFVTAKSESAWTYHEGDDGSVIVRNAYKLKNSNAKIAVMVGPGTASSGEMTAIAFIGKSNVKLIGGPTGGYTTANSSYLLSDGETFNLASSYCADRNKHKYFGKIQPDLILDSNINSPDQQLALASAWILGK